MAQTQPSTGGPTYSVALMMSLWTLSTAEVPVLCDAALDCSKQQQKKNWLGILSTHNFNGSIEATWPHLKDRDKGDDSTGVWRPFSSGESRDQKTVNVQTEISNNYSQRNITESAVYHMFKSNHLMVPDHYLPRGKRENSAFVNHKFSWIRYNSYEV